VDFCGQGAPEYRCSGGQFASKLNDLDIALPPGLIGNPLVGSRCQIATFNAGGCSSDTKIGTASVWAINNDGEAAVKSDGNVYNLQPQGSELARLGSYFSSGRTQSVATLRTNGDYGVDVSLDSIVSAVPGAKVSRLETTLYGQSTLYMRNPSSCAQGTVTVRAAYQGNDFASGSASFTPTSCALVPFSPTASASVTTPTETARGTTPALDFGFNLPADNSALKKIVVTMPSAIRPTVAAIHRHACKADQAAAGCPGVPSIGTATVTVPFLSQPLSGPVHLIEVPGQLALDMTARLSGQLSVQFNGRASFNGSRSVTTMDSLPDVPISSLQLALAGGADGVFTAAGNLCNSALRADVELVGHAGKSSSQSVPITVPCGGTGVSVKGGTVRVSDSGTAPVGLSCSARGPDCSGTLAIETGGAKKSGGKVRKLGTTTFRVEGGKTSSVVVKLSVKAKKSLGLSGRLKARATATAGSAKATASLQLKGKKA
jgi:hypothetical protein